MLSVVLLLAALVKIIFCDTCPKDNFRHDCLPRLGPEEYENASLSCRSRSCNWCPKDGVVPDCVHSLSSDNCPLEAKSRVDCYSGQGLTRERCLNRGCTYCESPTPGVPWCYHPTLSRQGGHLCPKIPESERIECLRIEFNPNPDACAARGCFYCETKTPNVPWCFYDSRDWDLATINNDKERIDCMPQGGLIDSHECITRGCIYRPTKEAGAPWCYMPPKSGYKIVGSAQETALGFRIFLKKASYINIFSTPINEPVVDIEFRSESSLRIKISDAKQKRFEVPLKIGNPKAQPSRKIYKLSYGDEPTFWLKVTRTDNGVVVFDTTLGGLILEDQFLQLATRLPSDNIYGFGEHQHPTFRHDLHWKSWGMWSRDQPPTGMANLYGVHPFYTCLENDGNSHGVLFLNANAQDVTLMPAPALTYRTIGGVLDVFILMGPSPENVIQSYTSTIGRPFMPPYWTLGFSLAKYGYQTLQNMKDTIDRLRNYDIPHDYQFGDIDYMDRNLDFTYSHDRWPGLPNYVKELKENGTRFIIILDPAIANGLPNYKPYITAKSKDIWVKDRDGVTPVEAKVWPPTNVYFPDFTNPAAHEWWINSCKEFYKELEFEGLWIDMNEPANFFWGSANGCPKNKWNNPPYFPKIYGPELFYKTLCSDHKHMLSRHYDVHSLYGWTQSSPSLQAARESTGKRSIVLSRSTFPGSGKYAAHWLGDNWSTWESMRSSVIGMLEFNLFGMPMVGADICGFIQNSDYELCLRWQQLGAFYPFSRNHNLGFENKDQDPGVWGADFARIIRDALHIRYTLLPYLYTLFHEAHTQGTTVVRPIHHEFPQDSNTKYIDRQFLWGRGFMVSPVLFPNTFQISAYFPKARWYDYYNGQEISELQKYITLNAPMDHINLHVRGGSILPTQEPARSTKFSRKNPMGLIVGLDENNEASGTLYWDNGESIDTFENGNYLLVKYSIKQNTLTGEIQHNVNSAASNLKLNTIRIFGGKSVSSVIINGKKHTNLSFSSQTKELKLFDLQLELTSAFTINL